MDLKQDSGYFDLVIDKGCLDCIFCADDPYKCVEKALT